MDVSALLLELYGRVEPLARRAVEGLTAELNFNLMHSKRTMIDVVQTYPKLRELRRRQLAMDIHGSTYQQITVEELRRRIPALTGAGPGSSVTRETVFSSEGRPAGDLIRVRLESEPDGYLEIEAGYGPEEPE